MSFNCRNRLNKLLNNAFPSIDLRFIFSNDSKISKFFRIKDKILDKVCSNICYKFTCPGCTNRYVGCSTRAFHFRIMDQNGKSYRTGQTLQSPPFSSVRDHARGANHRFSPSNFETIAKLRSESDTFIAEKILIDRLKPELNRST